jgi:hypothetical protein
MRPVRQRLWLFTLSVIGATAVPAVSPAQVAAPTTVNSLIVSVGSGGILAGTMSNATGAAGTGYSTRVYGTATPGPLFDRLRIDAFVGTPGNIRFDTRTVASSASAAPDNLSTLPGTGPFGGDYRWTVFQPTAGDTSSTVRFRDNAGVFVNPTNFGDLATYNTQLNNVLRFAPEFLSASQPGFINPDTGAPIVPGTATTYPGFFRFEFTNFVAGIGFRNVDLVYTPVPEPGLILGLSAAALGVARLRRRLMA